MVHSLALHFDENSFRLPQSLLMYSNILISYILESYMQFSTTRRQTNMDDYYPTDAELY